MVSFNNVLLMVRGTWCSPYELLVRIRLQAKPGLFGNYHKSPLLRCPHNAWSLLQSDRRRTRVALSGTHLTGLRAYRPICTKRLYTVCLKTVAPVAEES
ncbi:hypothetical protein TNCV_4389661 [Trichonephila clavipes]|nr:hypothetical protein TNCV_4389661 [Trichonephila clavipes]